MVLPQTIFFALASLSTLTNAAPLSKRIAQVISDSTQQWVQACTAAGGAEKCGTISQTAFMTLLAGAGDCDQQNAADAMVDLANSLEKNAKMISLAQVFAQQPRNSPNKLSVSYCQQQPKNAELKGLFQCQFQGVDPKTFTNNVDVGGLGTIPLGLNAPLDPPGSCKANPQGGIADGSQLVTLTQDPGVNNDGGANTNSSTSGATNAGAAGAPPSEGPSDGGNPDISPGSASGNNGSAAASGSEAGSSAATVTVAASTVTITVTSDASAPTDSAPPTGGSAQSGSGSGGSGDTGFSDSAASKSTSANGPTATGGFQLQNGKDAQALNTKFTLLTDSSACTDGDQACVNKGFAQCVGGKFQVMPCASGTQCFALPLVNKAGTSIACTTQSDATSRIQATGASGGLTGA